MKVIITCYVDDFKYSLSKGHEIGDAVDELFEGKCSEYTVEVKNEEQRLPQSADRITGLPHRKETKQMKNVIVISEENHGTIGVAVDEAAAIRFLIAEDWVDDLWDEEQKKYVYHETLFDRYGVDNLLDLMLKMYAENEDCFDGMFYFCKTKLFE